MDSWKKYFSGSAAWYRIQSVDYENLFKFIGSWRISSWFSYYNIFAIHFIHFWINESAGIRSHYMTKLYSCHSPLIHRKGKPNKTPPSTHTVSVFADAKKPLQSIMMTTIMMFKCHCHKFLFTYMYRISRLHDKNSLWWDLFTTQVILWGEVSDIQFF